MATNSGRGFRHGPVTGRSQSKNPATGDYTKRNTQAGRFMDSKEGGSPFKGVRREK